MNHQPYRKWIQLGLYEELSAEERQALDGHLQSCVECRTEMEQVQALHANVRKVRHFEVTDELLMEARQEFRAALRNERSTISLWQQITETVDALFAPPLKVALGGAFMLAVGFLGGYMMFRSPAPNDGTIAQSMSKETELTRGESQITNVKFVDADPSDGEIEFRFDAVTPLQVKGSPNDPGVQSVLVRALANEENPGTRLRAVSAITSPMVKIEFGKQDNQVKEALINAMKYDENPAVRKEALKALTKLPFDDDVKQGLIYVLTKDKNEGMRVDAINILTAVKGDLKSSDDRLMDILRKKVESDNNNYIRLRARAVLQEVQR